jgi:EAL and modified HD-GYP domain-containing signal transduction protein
MSNIVQNARQALLIMNERGLAPTPENYARIYTEVSGVEASSPLNVREIVEQNRKLAQYLEELAGDITGNAEDLSGQLQKKREVLSQIVTELEKTGDKFKISPLLRPVAAELDSVRETINTSQSRLAHARQVLQGISVQLAAFKDPAPVVKPVPVSPPPEPKASGGNLDSESSSPFIFPSKSALKAKPDRPKGAVAAKLDEDLLFLGRLPILYTDHALFGYDLSFYSSTLGRAQPPIELRDIADYLDKVGVDRLTHEHLGFVPLSRDELMGADIRRLPAKQLALEIMDVSEIDQKALERCLELKEKGFKLSLGDYFDYPVYDGLLKVFDYAKLDIDAVSNFEMNNAIERLKGFGHIHRIAKSVNTLEAFGRAQEMHFHLVQGLFFAHSDAARLGAANPQQTTLLVVLGQLLTDVDLPRIERAFQNEEELTASLLALVNSAAMGLSRKVDSLQQALVILGRRQLMRWVQVLLYSHSNLRNAQVLLQMAAVRAKLMDLICSTHAEAEKRHDIYRDRAFTVGILSLTHVLLGMDLVEVLDQIGLDDEIRQALLEREGFFGYLLTMTEKLEIADFEAVDVLLEDMNVAPRDLNRAQRETLAWVHNLGKTAE